MAFAVVVVAMVVMFMVLGVMFLLPSVVMVITVAVSYLHLAGGEEQQHCANGYDRFFHGFRFYHS